MKKENVVCFDFCRTFVPAALCKNLPGYYNISCLDKPGWAGFFPLEGFRMVSLPPFRASFILKKATHHAHRNHATAPTPTRQVPAHTTPAPSSQAQQPHPKTSIYNNAFGKVLSVAAIGLAAFYTLNF